MAPNIFYWDITRGYSKDCLFIAYREEGGGATKTLFFPEGDARLPKEIRGFKNLKERLDSSSENIKPMELLFSKDKKSLPSPHSLESNVVGSSSEQSKEDIVPMVSRVVDLSPDQSKKDVTEIMHGFLKKQTEFDVNGWSDWLNLQYKWYNAAFSIFKNALKVAAATFVLACGVAINPTLSLVLMDILCGYADGLFSITSAAIGGMNVLNYVFRRMGLRHDREKEFLSVLEEAIKEVSCGDKTHCEEKEDDENEKDISKEMQGLRKRRKLKRALKWKLQSLPEEELKNLTAAIQDEKNKESKLVTFIDEKLKDFSGEKLTDVPDEESKDVPKSASLSQSTPASQSDSKKTSSKKTFAEKWDDWNEKWKPRILLLISTSLTAASYVARMSLYWVRPLVTKLAGLPAATLAVTIFSASCIALTAISVSINLYVSINRFRRILNGEDDSVEKVEGQERGLKFPEKVLREYRGEAEEKEIEWEDLPRLKRFYESLKHFYESVKACFRRTIKGKEVVEKVEGPDCDLTPHQKTVLDKYREEMAQKRAKIRAAAGYQEEMNRRRREIKEWKDLPFKVRFDAGCEAFKKYGTWGEIVGLIGGVTSILFMSLVLAGIIGSGAGIIAVLATSAIAAVCSRYYYKSYMKNLNRGKSGKKNKQPLAPKEDSRQAQAQALLQPQQAAVNQPVASTAQQPSEKQQIRQSLTSKEINSQAQAQTQGVLQKVLEAQSDAPISQKQQQTCQLLSPGENSSQTQAQVTPKKTVGTQCDASTEQPQKQSQTSQSWQLWKPRRLSISQGKSNSLSSPPCSPRFSLDDLDSIPSPPLSARSSLSSLSSFFNTPAISPPSSPLPPPSPPPSPSSLLYDHPCIIPCRSD